MALMLEVQLTEADKRCSSLCSRLHRGEHREGSQTARRGAAYTGGDRPRRTVLSTGNSTETQVQTFFYCEGAQTQAQIAQRGCGVSILGDTGNPTGHGPGQPAPVDPALSGAVGDWT